tara:strand:+ start:162 stop:578 length:417 start_codon:yes stop_codon:yes gene_type:complete
MSTLNVDALVGNTSANAITVRGEGSATTSLQQGLAKAWLSMNGTGTIAVRDSFNMTGITDQAVGVTTVTIANNMGNAEYSVGGVSGAAHSVSDNVRLGMADEQETPTTTLFRTITRGANDNNNRDVLRSFVQVFGDLA